MSTSVKFSQDTLEILRNISKINNSLAFKAGNKLKTMSVQQSIIAEADISETLPQDFSIYELAKFLSVLELPNMKDADLVFDGDDKVQIKSAVSSINYYFTEQSFITHPDKVITLPVVDLTVKVTQESLDNLMKAAATLGHKMLKFEVVDKVARMVATTPEIDTSNDYSEDLGTVDAEDGQYKIKVENIRILPGDYNIEICAKGLTRFTHTSRPIVYYIALERN